MTKSDYKGLMTFEVELRSDNEGEALQELRKKAHRKDGDAANKDVDLNSLEVVEGNNE